jgi:hypothetical protein
MKRYGHLWEQILERENLRLAYLRAVRGKRHRPDARQFVADLDVNLATLAAQIANGSVELGRSQQFVIRDPKERIITAPCFEERVLHHAVMNVCEPLLDRWLICDTYACRVGKGRESAVRRAREFAQRWPAYLKMDVRKYFDSIPHAILLDRLRRFFKDPNLLSLFERIVGSFHGATGRGLPIGSLTSQHFANFYLGWFDRFVKERLQVRGYVRYMDDLVIWGATTRELATNRNACTEFLATELGLELKPSFINRSATGLDFLGCRVFPTHVTLNRRSKVRFRRRLTELEAAFARGEFDEATLQSRATAMVAFTRSADAASWRFRQAVLQDAR